MTVYDTCRHIRQKIPQAAADKCEQSGREGGGRGVREGVSE